SVRESPVDFFHWSVRGIGHTPEVATEEMSRSRTLASSARKTRRQVFFEHGFSATQCYDGSKLQYDMTVEGPAVVEQENTTVVLCAGQRLDVTRVGDFIINL